MRSVLLVPSAKVPVLGVISATPEAVLNTKSASEAFVKTARVPSAAETVKGCEGAVPIPTLELNVAAPAALITNWSVEPLLEIARSPFTWVI